MDRFQTPDMPQIVIIGAGITGLSAAHALDTHADIGYTIVEGSARLGGKIRTEVVEASGRFVVEAGPDSLLAQKPAGTMLAQAVGIGERLIGNNQQDKTVAILSRGRLVPMPAGLNLVVPLKPWPFLQSSLLSFSGRVRALAEPLVPKRTTQADESLADCIRRRFGQELLERIAEPLMSGIHNADCEQQSIQATFPRFHHAEQRHGSVTRGMRAHRRNQPPTAAAFASFPNGLQELVNALAGRLRGEVRTDSLVHLIEHNAAKGGYRVLLANGDILNADAVIVTTPAASAATLLTRVQPALAERLRELRTVSTGIVSLAFRRDDAAPLSKLTGVLVPRIEGHRINAITVASTKWPDRAPPETVLLRVFVGGAQHPELLALDDEALLRVVRAELDTIIGIRAAPQFAQITRWLDANPQYDVGHLERLQSLESLCPPGIMLAGCAYRGVGIPDCIEQGQAAALQAVHAVQRHYQTDMAIEQ